MTIVATTEESHLITQEHYGHTAELREYIGTIERLERGPQAFTSKTPPGFTFTPHYHLADQCQVFVEGGARMPTHDANPVTLHYADAYTAYGPIEVRDGGLKFFNFRPRGDVGAQRMPESRRNILIRGGREIVTSCRLRLGDEVATLRLETLIDIHEDGLAAYELLAAPGAHLPDIPASGNGRFHLILDGELCLDHRRLPRHSVAYTKSGEHFGPRTAGSAGAHVLEIHFPQG